MGLQWFKDFGNVKNKDKEPYQPGAKNWNRNELQDIAAGLEKAFKDLDPVGYRQYRILVYGQEEEHSLSVNKCDEEDFEKMGGSADLSIAVGFSEVVDESQSKITYSLASVRTVVDGMRCIDSGKEKEKEKQVHYETWGLQHIPTHKEIHWRRSIFFNLKVWRGMTCYSESWSLQPLASHPTEIAGIRQRFKDVTRRKQYGCSIGMEIKADRDVEWKMQEDYLRGVVEILGEMAEESILCLCRMRGR
ncbi:hypothetical protein OCU04_000596 [Sclerotinia nivalis]|uniref:Uncharacterized protein n=1 Tax=Sclerotinia nivalis TaxID=352851 RepID=A0A9X0AWY2_9HELO|nr:hypothetical protein OCU04_000596 [Sclerotinia nivalis]